MSSCKAELYATADFFFAKYEQTRNGKTVPYEILKEILQMECILFFSITMADERQGRDERYFHELVQCYRNSIW